jgi:hypothetical protein
MRWVRHIAYRGEKSILIGKLSKRALGNVDSDGRIILKWIFNK